MPKTKKTQKCQGEFQRFGNQDKGERLITWFNTPLCQGCADIWDECVADGMAEHAKATAEAAEALKYDYTRN